MAFPAAAAPQARGTGSLDALQLYLQEIAGSTLLSREEEVALGTRAREGDDEAVDELVRRNLRFVVNIAKRYAHLGVPLSDLINDGNWGLVHAARRFDERRGVRFITYAVHWIRQSILRALPQQVHALRVPARHVGQVAHAWRERRRLEQLLGRAPTFAEITEATGLEAAEVEQVLAATAPVTSLDAPSANGSGRLLDYLPDPTPHDTDADLLESARSERIREIVARLPAREQEVLRLSFGLDGEEPMTLDAIGEALGASRERVRQIRNRALSSLRGRRELREYSPLRDE